ncbi:MAG: DedA family protein [Desulfobacterales bacterium]|jgi:membrane protein DedA with SNARE-associated domain
MSAEALLAAYGYAALYVGAIVEGESFMMAGALLAAQGILDFPGVLAAGFFGALTGDQFFFYLGRYQGSRFLRSRPGWQRRTESAVRFLERFQGLVVPGLRFFYGLRAAIPFALGMGGYRRARFLLLNTTGAVLWTAAMAAAGVGVQTLWTRMGATPLIAVFLGLGALACTCAAVIRRRRPVSPPEKGE